MSTVTQAGRWSEKGRVGYLCICHRAEHLSNWMIPAKLGPWYKYLSKSFFQLSHFPIPVACSTWRVLYFPWTALPLSAPMIPNHQVTSISRFPIIPSSNFFFSRFLALNDLISPPTVHPPILNCRVWTPIHYFPLCSCDTGVRYRPCFSMHGRLLHCIQSPLFQLPRGGHCFWFQAEALQGAKLIRV